MPFFHSLVENMIFHMLMIKVNGKDLCCPSVFAFIFDHFLQIWWDIIFRSLILPLRATTPRTWLFMVFIKQISPPPPFWFYAQDLLLLLLILLPLPPPTYLPMCWKANNSQTTSNFTHFQFIQEYKKQNL